MSLSLAISLAMLAVATIVAFRRPRRAVTFAVFLSPWAGLGLDVGVQVTPYLAFVVPLMALAIHKIVTSPAAGRLPVDLAVPGFVIACGVAWSVIQIPFLPEAQVAGGILRAPELRASAQIAMFLITTSPMIIVALFARTFHDLDGIAKAYILSCVVLSVIGWLQIAVWIATGTDPLPIEFFNRLVGGEANLRSGMFALEGMTIYRMSSVGGEPKALGSSVALALILLQAKERGRKGTRHLVWIFLFASLVATFSTLAWFSWAAGTILQRLAGRGLRLRIPRVVGRIRPAIGAAAVSISLVAAFILVFAPDSSVVRVVESRTIDRIIGNESAGVEDFNAAVAGYLLDHPAAMLTGVGLGNIHLYAEPYLPTYAVSYASGTPFTAKSYSLRWISEIGLISFVVFMYWALKTIRKSVLAVRTHTEGREFSEGLARFALPALAIWAVSGYVVPQFFITLGCVVSAYRAANRFEPRRHLAG